MTTKKQLQEIVRLQTEIARQGLDLSATMDLVVSGVMTLTGADGAAIEFAEDDQMVYRAVSGMASNDLGLRLNASTSLSGLCVSLGQLLRCEDSEQDDRVDRNACRKVGLRSMVVVPLRFRDTVVGVLKAMSRSPHFFNEGHQDALKQLCEVVAASMYFSTRLDGDLLYRSTHDAMTGLANRALFMDRLRSVIQQYGHDGQAFGLLSTDINGLKTVNDTWGHRAGDALICEFARLLKTNARSTDLVARLGGDEFAVIMSPVQPSAVFDAIVSRITAALKSEFEFDGKKIQLSGSVGVACFPKDAMTLNDLVDRADERMYAAKREHYLRRDQNRLPG